MRNRLSIFSSRILGSALIWTVLAIAWVEWRAGDALPFRYANHEVDQLLYLVDRAQGPGGDTLFLGDSVGRQVARAIARQEPSLFVPLASNGGIETIGQYFMLKRYLARHPAPRRVILMMLNPMEGMLDGKYTENYFQRGFLHGREIAEAACSRRSLSFALVMAGYKFSPVFRHRLGLQDSIPWLETPSPWSGLFEETGAPPQAVETPEHGLLDIGASWLKKFRKAPQISAIYFDRMAALLEERGIELLFLAPPLPASSIENGPGGAFGRQLAQVEARQARYRLLRVHAPFQIYPSDWFGDGIHLKEERLSDVARDYAAILQSMGAGKSMP